MARINNIASSFRGASIGLMGRGGGVQFTAGRDATPSPTRGIGATGLEPPGNGGLPDAEGVWFWVKCSNAPTARPSRPIPIAVLFWLIKLPAIDFNPPPWRRLVDTRPVSPWPSALL